MRYLRRLNLIAAALIVALVALSAFSVAAPSRQPASLRASTSPAVPARLSPGAAPTPPLLSHGTVGTGRAALAKTIVQRIRDAGVPMTDAFLPNLMAQPEVVKGVVAPYYTVGPAPMGIGDFGVRNLTGTPVGSILQSQSWQGTLTLNGINATYLDNGVPDWFTVQLNTVMDNTTVKGVSNYHFWIQNVIQYSSLTNSLTFLDNIWNFSNPSASEPLGTFYQYCPSGIGGPVPPVFYYCVGPTYTVPFPFTVHLYVNSSLTVNSTANKAWSTVTFGYNVVNGVGGLIAQGIYDTVLFNSNVSATPVPPPTPKFTVNGLATNPLGLLDDSEIMIGGPGGGSTTTIFAVNGTEQLQYKDMVTGAWTNDPTAWNEGTDTGETSEGLSEYYTTAGSVSLSPGPSIPMPFWNATPGGNIGKSVVQGTATPSTSFFFFNQGTTYREAQAAYAPVPPSGQFAWAMPPGSYYVRTLASEFLENDTALTLSAGTHTYNVRMTANPFIGIYTPLWAWGNSQLPWISSGGVGTVANPFILDNYEPGALDPVFGEFNDYLYPVFSGIFLGYTNAQVEIFAAAPFFIIYPASYDAVLARSGLPDTNNLPIQGYFASGISIWQSSFSGWTSGSLFFGGVFAPIGDVGFWGVTNSLIGQSFFSDEGSAIVSGLGGNNVIWGNTIVTGPQLPSFYAGGIPLGIQLIEGGDLVYNNIVTTVIPAYSPNTNFLTGAPQLNKNRWNLTGGAEPASHVNVVNGHSLSGSTVGSPWQCGNLWGNYVPGGPLPYNDSFGGAGFISTLGDFCPSPIGTHAVTFTETGLPAGGIWSVSLADITASAGAGTPIVIQAPPGTWSYSVGAPGHTVSPSGGTVTVASSPVNVPVSISGALAVSASALFMTTDVGVSDVFLATALGGAGGYSYLWNFGDASTSSTPAALHAYSAAGTDTVTLTVTDASGASQSQQFTVVVNTALAPVSATTATTDVGLTASLTATESGGTAPYLYSWDWSDGSVSSTSTASASHAFASAATHTVTVTVLDAGGGRSTATTSVIVNALPTVTIGSSAATPLPGDVVTFTSTVTGGSGSPTYSWDFGDSSTAATTANPTHSFAATGTYTVKITVTDAAGATTQSTMTINVVASSVTTTAAIVYSAAAFIIGAVVVAVVMTLLARRRKETAPPPGPPQG